MEPFVKLSDVAKMTGLSRVTIRRWALAGEGPTVFRGPSGLILFRRTDVERWARSLAEHSEGIRGAENE